MNDDRDGALTGNRWQLHVRKLAVALAVTMVTLTGTVLIARELGPTIYLRTMNSDGLKVETKVWYVKRHGDLWVRAGTDARPWYLHLRDRPIAEVGSGDVWQPVLAVPDDSNAAREAFQRWLEEAHPVLGRLPRLGNLDRAVPVRLEPRPRRIR